MEINGVVVFEHCEPRQMRETRRSRVGGTLERLRSLDGGFISSKPFQLLERPTYVKRSPRVEDGSDVSAVSTCHGHVYKFFISMLEWFEVSAATFKGYL